jgi:hypothetical protein
MRSASSRLVVRCRDAGGSATDDEVVKGFGGDSGEVQLVRQLVVVGFGEVRAVGENDGGDNAATGVEHLDDGGGLGSRVYGDSLEGDPLLGVEGLGAPTI